MKGSKGLELPINVIVIVAIAVLVLVVAAALFSSQFGAGAGTIQLEQAYTKACNILRTRYNCDIGQWGNAQLNQGELVIQQGDSTKSYSLSEICTLKKLDQNSCARNCGCPTR